MSQKPSSFREPDFLRLRQIGLEQGRLEREDKWDRAAFERLKKEWVEAAGDDLELRFKFDHLCNYWPDEND